MNRAMFVTMLSRMHLISDGTEIIDGDYVFPDVPADGWYSAPARWAAEAVQWAVAAGIIQGSDNKLNPGGSATRAQVATIIINFMDHYAL